MDARLYELTIAYPIDDSTGDLEKAVEQMLSKTGVSVKGTDDWGQKSLSFRLKKHDEATFSHMKIEATAEQINNLKQQLTLERGLLRWLIVTA